MDRQSTIHNKVKYLQTVSIFVLFIMLISAFVFIVLNVILFLFNFNIQDWRVQFFIYINIFTLLLTEMFRLDDSTGGYKHILDNSYVGIVVSIASIMVVLKYNNHISTTNEQLVVYFLMINMILIVIKNVIRNYL